MQTPPIQTLITDAQQVLNLKSLSEIRATTAAALASANVGDPLNPALTTQQLWDEFYEIVRQTPTDIESIITQQLMKFLYFPPAPGGLSGDQEVIFNAGGFLTGDPGLKYNQATDALTITGDLTAARWLVSGGSLPGLGNGNPFAYRIGGGGLGIGAATETGTTAPIVFYCGAGGVEQYRIAPLGVNTWSDGAGGTRMTLNSTGLGVGMSPLTDRLTIFGSAGVNVSGGFADISFRNSPGTAIQRIRYTDGTGALTIGSATGIAYPVELGGDTVGRAVIIDGSKNVGVGVTPSAWSSTYKALQVSSVAGLSCNSGSAEVLLSNNYFRAASQDQYITTNFATIYQQVSGSHRFYTAPSGTAGNAITFTQAMTLDASGSLLVGTTTLNGAWDSRLTLSKDSGTTKWAVGPWVGGETNFIVSASASAGVYLNGTSATSWSAVSDERFKDIIEPITNAVAKVGSLRAVIGKLKVDQAETRKTFLIAQDVQAVLPEAVDSSNPDKLGLAYTDVIPLLVAAIKELTARVQTLEAR